VGVYCVHSGRLKLTKSGAGGRRQILALPGPGDLLGTPAVIADRSHDVTAEVLEESRVCFIEKRPFTERLDAHPPLFRDVVRRLIQGMEGLENRLVDQVDKPVHARLARLLRGLGESLGRAGPKGLHLDLPLSREELSEMIGTTPETTIRLLGEFRKRKLVRLEGRGIVLLDLAGLRREENDG
jgi:CRP/FNR family transcriptional regulator